MLSAGAAAAERIALGAGAASTPAQRESRAHQVQATFRGLMDPPAPPDSAPDPAQQRALEARRANQAERKANKRAELKAKAAEKRRLLEQQRAAQDEKLQQGLAVDTSHGDQAEEERLRAAREAAELRRKHEEDAQKHAAALNASSLRRQQDLNRRLAKKRKELENETTCFGLCKSKKALDMQARGTAVRQVGVAPPPIQAASWDDSAAGAASGRPMSPDVESGLKQRRGASRGSLKRGQTGRQLQAVDEAQARRPEVKQIKGVLASNMVGGLPTRKKPLWIELGGAGERAGKWVQLFPCRIVEGGKAFSAMETVAFEPSSILQHIIHLIDRCWNWIEHTE